MRRLFPVLIVVFSVSSLLIFLFGDSGVMAHDDLASYRARLAANVADLEERNAELEARLKQLRGDPETERVLARDLGLYEPGDEVIRIEGRQAPSEVNAVGDLLRYRGGSPARSSVIKAAALGLSLLLLGRAVFLSLAARRRTNAGPGR